MSNSRRRVPAWWAVTLSLASAAVCAGESPEGGRFYGMLRSRDLTPFGFLRLDMRPAHALSIESGTFAFEAELGYQNTWALSENVEKYLKSLGALRPPARSDPRTVQAIRDLPGENYLLDLESATLDLTVHYKLSEPVDAVRDRDRGVVPRRLHGLGHREVPQNVGFSTFGRHALERNDTNLIYDLKGSQVVPARPPQPQGFLDPTFGLRYTGIKLPGRWQMSVGGRGQGAAAMARGRCCPRDARTTALQASVRRLGERNALHVDLAAVYYAGEEICPRRTTRRSCPRIVIGWERQADRAHQREPAGLCEQERVPARADGSRRAAQGQVPAEPGCAAPLRQLHRVVRASPRTCRTSTTRRTWDFSSASRGCRQLQGHVRLPVSRGAAGGRVLFRREARPRFAMAGRPLLVRDRAGHHGAWPWRCTPRSTPGTCSAGSAREYLKPCAKS